jgi:hypothetical protein
MSYEAGLGLKSAAAEKLEESGVTDKVKQGGGFIYEKTLEGKSYVA